MFGVSAILAAACYWKAGGPETLIMFAGFAVGVGWTVVVTRARLREIVRRNPTTSVQRVDWDATILP